MLGMRYALLDPLLKTDHLDSTKITGPKTALSLYHINGEKSGHEKKDGKTKTRKSKKKTSKKE